jgi:hypothetical protein
MSIPNPNKKKGGRRPHRPILRSEIEEAQRNTNSNMAAARFLGVDYRQYRKYAKLYNLFDQHLNERGVGIDKGFSKKATSVPLKEIFENKHPKYSLARLKNRLIARKKLDEKCNLCGFDEKRITDKKVPLIINFINGEKDYTLSNLELLCYNCMFLTTGAPSVVHRGQIEKSFTEPERIPIKHQISIKESDYYPSALETSLEDVDIQLSPEEIRKLLEEE